MKDLHLEPVWETETPALGTNFDSLVSEEANEEERRGRVES